MTRVRLIADDLTGALDGAAQLSGLGGAVAICLEDALPDGSWAMDSDTREADVATAAARLYRLAPALQPQPGEIAFLKLDSLLRGHAGTEIAAVAKALPGIDCLVAPAFPYQGRLTRVGRQWVRDGTGPVGEDLLAALHNHGIPVTLCRPGDPVPGGVSLWDAEDDAELDRVVALGQMRKLPLLWCGTAGLAGALARNLSAPPPPVPVLSPPLLGLIGSDHPVARSQVIAADALTIPDTGAAAVAAIRKRMTAGAALVCFALPQAVARADAADRIMAMLRTLVVTLPAPGSLVVSGGATLRALCTALGTRRLDVLGQCEPGIPVSILHGGTWDGVPVVSKSGAFGPPDLLVRLISQLPLQGSRV